ncbi:Hemerythrin HHE cation binding domain-containing protein [Pseudosulfitobacter pseudonitzschiae]|uniref:Hemerythrin-like domain-containing protein n=1 Tax=Pseudosulfitobacter pseudonitzschiae TaxID=1402135 RepID=A0A073J0Q7_9RHOB|nr:hemerythrin domain-containing protein [Pseudosulfitobacter pseudonitzschiae]KEJ95440.1 hypothetical protein SUH3_20865 [Pseudosulfitobacter pseudonitzschiae]QKS10034.1 hemerythrin domain-containing protein [Pseudosulfitobacter pseudonitzschiae]SHE87686.1 Hemerythrin HHE cation binding domain-containing protein [Pseudosulfitobacter pseudonitzschiae]
MIKPAHPLALDQRDGLPDSLRVLADAYPRGTWEKHDNFNQMIQFWMQRHMMFRQLMELLNKDAEHLMDRKIGFKDYAPRLSHYAGSLLNELHGHHHIEDAHYFPQLIQLDGRIEKAFDLLESDHLAMDGLLHGMANGANAVLQGGEIGTFRDTLTEFGTLLERHLTDEEDIVVPVVLETGFQG